MKNILISLFCICLLASCKGQSSDNRTIDKITEDNQFAYSYNDFMLLKNIKILSSDVFEGRRTGTEGGIKARDYVVNQFKEFGILPLVNNYLQPFSFDKGENTYAAANVLGLIKGKNETQKYIVISAHYDHEGVKNGNIYNGADDDASGTSALFAFAEHFIKHQPNYNVILAAFDAEELGLKGAYYFVENSIVPIENIVLNLNMDMISRSDKLQLFAVGPGLYPELKVTVENFQDFGKVDLLIGHEGLDTAQNWTYSSDHAAFHKAKIPFIYFGVADHKDYHKPTDDFENIDPAFYKDAVQTIINVFQKLDDLQF